MTSSLSGRLAKLEHSRHGPAPYVIELPHDHLAWSADPDLAEAATRDAVTEHAARTGYTGFVLIAPPMRETEEKWLRLHGREATR